MLALICALAWCADPTLDFVHLTDTHVLQLAGVHPQITATRVAKRNTATGLPRVLRQLAKDPASAFVLITGDLTDAYSYESASGGIVSGQMETLRAIFESSPLPIFPLLGNHDITRIRHGETKPATDQQIAADIRGQWRSMFPAFRNGTYYSFERTVGRTSYCFIMLDDVETEGLNPEFAAGQVRWLREQLAAHRSGRIIVAMHIPLASAPYRSDLEAAIGSAPNVALILAGHRHNDAMDELALGGRQVLAVRTAALFMGDSHWRKIRLREDRIEVFATGSATEVARTVTFAAAATATAGAH